MEKFLITIGIGIFFLVVQKFVTNPISQKILPTYESDGFARRAGYKLVHIGVLFGALLVVGLVASMFGF